jgi:ankyrin repeat protein
MGIFQAIENHDLHELKKILKKGVSIRERDAITLESPLSHAVNLDNEDSVKVLLEYGFFPDYGGWTSNLNNACSKENLKIVELLLSAGADPNYCVCDSTPLIEAAHTGNIEIIQLLINSGADPNIWLGNSGSALSASAHSFKVDAYRLLLKITSNEIINASNLYALTNSNNIKIISLLASTGFDLDTFDEENLYNALIFNAGSEDIDFVKALIDYNVEINIQNKVGDTALIIAARTGNHDMVKTLLDNGGDKNIKNSKGLNALNCALCNNRKKALSKILDFERVIEILS